MKSFYEARVTDVAVLYETCTTLSILSSATRHAKVSAFTAVPVLAFPSLHRMKVPNVASDAEDINAIHSNFKTIFRNQ